MQQTNACEIMVGFAKVQNNWNFKSRDRYRPEVPEICLLHHLSPPQRRLVSLSFAVHYIKTSETPDVSKDKAQPETVCESSGGEQTLFFIIINVQTEPVHRVPVHSP